MCNVKFISCINELASVYYLHVFNKFNGTVHFEHGIEKLVLLFFFFFFFSYTSDAPELYQRKLGDLAFLVQNYEFAYNCYHTAKREFNHEHAWFYFAGALVRKASINVEIAVCV